MNHAKLMLFCGLVVFVSFPAAFTESIKISDESLTGGIKITGTLKERGTIFLHIYAENKTVYRMVDYSSVNYPHSFQFQLERPLRLQNTYSLDTGKANSITSLNITSFGKHSEKMNAWLSTDKTSYSTEDTVRFFGASSSPSDHILKIESPSKSIMQYDLSIRPDLIFYKEIGGNYSWENGRHLAYLENPTGKIAAITSFTIKADAAKPADVEIVNIESAIKNENLQNTNSTDYYLLLVGGVTAAIIVSAITFWLLRLKGSKSETEPSVKDQSDTITKPEEDTPADTRTSGRQSRTCVLCNITFDNDEKYLEHQLEFHM